MPPPVPAFTLAEAVPLLNPPITETQLRQIIHALHWQPTGRRYTGRSGRPADTYSADRLFKLHAALIPFIDEVC